MNGPKRIGWIAAGLLLAVLMVSCALYRNDRAWLSDEKYALARMMYFQTGSLDLVQRRLQDMEWHRSLVNEAIYRLQKEFEVLPEEMPPAAAAAAPATTATTAILPAPPPPAGPSTR